MLVFSETEVKLAPAVPFSPLKCVVLLAYTTQLAEVLKTSFPLTVAETPENSVVVSPEITITRLKTSAKTFFINYPPCDIILHLNYII